MSGVFLSFEGPDGSGKTTQIRLLFDTLQQRKQQVLPTKEPGGTPIGDQLRALLHDLEYHEMVAMTEILLYSASRAQLVGQVIRPALERGEIVLCDRFYDSTIAYQGYGRGLDLKMLRVITKYATGGLKPDITLYLDLPVEEGLGRKKVGGGEWNRMDAEALAFHKATRVGYLELAKQEPERIRVLNVSKKSIETVQAEIWEVVHVFLAEK